MCWFVTIFYVKTKTETKKKYKQNKLNMYLVNLFIRKSNLWIEPSWKVPIALNMNIIKIIIHIQFNVINSKWMFFFLLLFWNSINNHHILHTHSLSLSWFEIDDGKRKIKHAIHVFLLWWTQTQRQQEGNNYF